MVAKHAAHSLVRRHSLVDILEHWLIAISGLVLVFSGFGELPMYKRYMLTALPGLSWAGDFHIQLKLHYMAAIVFVAAGVFHVLYHGLLGHRGLMPKRGDFSGSLKTILAMFGVGEEPKAHKFLPEQRLAYAFTAALSLILVATGIIKVIKSLPGVFLPPGLITTVTLIHTLSTMLFLFGILAHLGALLLKANRPLVRAILTGWVDARYAKERHSLWWDGLFSSQQALCSAMPAFDPASPDPSATGKDVGISPLGPIAPHDFPAQRSSLDEAPGSDGLPERSRAGER